MCLAAANGSSRGAKRASTQSKSWFARETPPNRHSLTSRGLGGATAAWALAADCAMALGVVAKARRATGGVLGRHALQAAAAAAAVVGGRDHRDGGCIGHVRWLRIHCDLHTPGERQVCAVLWAVRKSRERWEQAVGLPRGRPEH